MDRFISCTYSYIEGKLRDKSNEIIDKLCDDYYDKMRQYRNELVSNVLNGIDIAYSEDPDDCLNCVQIKITRSSDVDVDKKSG